MLHVISVGEAVALAKSVSSPVTDPEFLPLSLLSGRVTAKPLVSPDAVPAFSRSTMDGYAVKAETTYGASDASPIPLTLVGEVFMGQGTSLSLSDGDCAKIPTGGMLPANADAVVPVEYTESFSSDEVLVCKSVSPLENVTRKGDDVGKDGLLFPSFTRLTPAKIGVLAAAGIHGAEVLRRPKIGVLSTGNEVVPVESPLLPGQVRDVNAHLVSALLSSYGCESVPYGILPDDPDVFLSVLRTAAAETDMVLLSGGSSAGEKDLSAFAIGTLGEVLAHGIAMKPGKPTLIGKIGPTPVFGLPGHPAACYFVTETVVKPAVEVLLHTSLPPKTRAAIIADNISSNHGREEFVCVRLEGDNAVPVYGKSGVVSTLSTSDGYIVVGRDTEGLRSGSAVTVHLF